MGTLVPGITVVWLARESVYVAELPADETSHSSCKTVKMPGRISLDSVGFPGKIRSSSINCTHDY